MDEKNWINDPGPLTDSDFEADETTFSLFHSFGRKPEKLKDPKTAEKYRQWLTRYYLFTQTDLVKVVDNTTAFRFTDGKWVQCDSYTWRVTGMSGDCDFEDLTLEQAKRLFPRAFE